MDSPVFRVQGSEAGHSGTGFPPLRGWVGLTHMLLSQGVVFRGWAVIGTGSLGRSLGMF